MQTDDPLHPQRKRKHRRDFEIVPLKLSCIKLKEQTEFALLPEWVLMRFTANALAVTKTTKVKLLPEDTEVVEITPLKHPNPELEFVTLSMPGLSAN